MEHIKNQYILDDKEISQAVVDYLIKYGKVQQYQRCDVRLNAHLNQFNTIVIPK